MDEGNKNQQVKEGVAGNENPPATGQAVPSETKEALPSAPPVPKKGFPKIILYIGGGFLVVALLLFAIRFFTGGKIQKSELVWWGLRMSEVALEPLIDEYETNNPGVSVTYIKQSPQDYRERLTNSLAKGEGPDIFEIHNTWIPMFGEELSTIPEEVMTGGEYAKTFHAPIVNDMSSGSGFVGIPLFYDALTLFVNEDVFSSEDKNYPVTWDDLGKVALELTKRDENDVITFSGAALGRTENVEHWQEILGLLFFQNGASLVDPAGELAESTLNYFISFAKEDEGVWDTTMASSSVAFANGKVAMFFAPLWRINDILNINPALNFTTISLPQVAKATAEQPDVSYPTYWSEAVWERGTSKSEAWHFLKYMSEAENITRLHQAEANVLGISPRKDALEAQITDPLLGSVVRLAGDGQSWYLASNTFDGVTGINTQINSAYKTAIDNLNSRVTMKKVKEALLIELTQVLSKYFVFSN